MERKRYEDLTFKDDFMFCKVMERNEELCKEVLETILSTKVEIVKNVENQKSIEIMPDKKGIRLDVKLESEHAVYNIEMQNAARDDLPRRARYYQGLLDLDMHERGSYYYELKDSCIIFICNFDPFGADSKVYTITNKIEECPEVEYNDGTKKVFLSTTANGNTKISTELDALLKYIRGAKPNSKLTEDIEGAVVMARSTEALKKEYLHTWELKEEGRKAGLEEGRDSAMREVAAKLKKSNIALKTIEDLTGLSSEEIDKI